MKFVITTKETETGRVIGREPYDKPELKNREQIEDWVAETIAIFNRTLRPSERARELVSLEIEGESEKHEWQKSSLSTISGTHHYKGKIYDTYKCAKCGVTGKRFDLSERITIDPKFKRLKDKCNRDRQES